MAIQIVKGPMAQVELTPDPAFGGIMITCVAHNWPDGRTHGCGVELKCSTQDEAIEYASIHADTGE
jgi:hypothetical protein